MSRRRVRPITISQPLQAGLVGLGLGLLTFTLIAALRYFGDQRLAALAAESAFLLALTGVAAVIAFGRPAQLRRARVPVRRALPPQWWPRDDDTFAVIAVCVGSPVVAAAACSAALFH